MTTTETFVSRRHQMLNKVPEVTVYFWIIKILCTTVGESFADYINETLGFGLTNTTLLFSAALVAVLVVAVPGPAATCRGSTGSAVVLISVVGTLLTDNLTDGQGVPLWISTTVFAVLLAAVFAVWYARERTLSIHSINTTPREAFYWLAVLVTFALGTAAGDWTLELTGWTPGAAVLLPAGLIVAIVRGLEARRRTGADLLARLHPDPAPGRQHRRLPRARRTPTAVSAWAPWGPACSSSARSSATVVYLTVTRVDLTEDEPVMVES